MFNVFVKLGKKESINHVTFYNIELKWRLGSWRRVRMSRKRQRNNSHPLKSVKIGWHFWILGDWSRKIKPTSIISNIPLQQRNYKPCKNTRNIYFFILVYIPIFKLKNSILFLCRVEIRVNFLILSGGSFFILEIKCNHHDKVINMNIIITLWIITKS